MERCLLPQMHRHQYKATQTTENYANVTPPKESNRGLITGSKEMEIYDLHDKEYKIIILNCMKWKKTQRDTWTKSGKQNTFNERNGERSKWWSRRHWAHLLLLNTSKIDLHVRLAKNKLETGRKSLLQPRVYRKIHIESGSEEGKVIRTSA